MKTKIFQWLLLVCKFVQFIVGLLPGGDDDAPGDKEGVAKEAERGKRKREREEEGDMKN